MKRMDLMKILSQNKEILIDALVLSIRNCKYGGDFPFFSTNDEAYAVIKHFYEELESLDNAEWLAISHLKSDYVEGSLTQENLSELRDAITKDLMISLDLLAVIEKAKETVMIDDLCKGVKDGNSKERHYTDTEI